MKLEIKKVKKNKYYCKHCKKTVERESTKQWIKSYCDETERYVHLTKIISTIK